MQTLYLASYPKHAGRERLVLIGGTYVKVVNVSYDDRATPHDIVYVKFTADYKRMSARPYHTRQSAYGTLKAAATAILRARATGPTDDQFLAALGPCGK